MAGLLGEMTVRLGVNTSQFTSGLGSAQSTLQSFASKASSINPVVGAVVGLGVAAVGVGAASIKMAADYQQSMTMVQQLTGSSTEQMQKYSDGIKSLSNETGKSSQDLSKGLYQVISAGFQGSDAMKILSLSSKDSVISMSDQETTTKALVVALGSYGLSAKEADNVSAQMLKTVSLGRMSLNDYAGALSTGAAAAHKHNISLAEMNATLATLTSGGVKTAGVAMTDFTALLTSMDTKTDLMSKRIHSLGLSFDESKFKTMSYTDKINYLNTTLKDHKDMEDWVLQSKNAGQALAVLGTHSDMLKTDIAQLSDKQKLAADSAKAWDATQQTFNQTMARLQAQVQNLMISLGTVLLPIVTKVAAGFGKFISVFTDVGDSATGVGQLFQGMADNWLAIQDSIDITGISKAFKDFGDTVAKAFQDIIPLVGPFLNNLNNMLINVTASLSSWLVPALKIAGQIVTGVAGNFKAWMLGLETNVIPAVQNLVEAIAPLVKNILDWIANSKIIPTVFANMQNSIKTTTSIIGGLINGIANVIKFFEKNKAAALALVPVLGALGGYFVFLGVQALVAFLATLPETIAGFIAMAGAAWTAAIGVLAVAWPFLLIGAIIAVVVVGIILAIKNWGSIVKWLQGVWGGISKWWNDLWSGISKFFQDIWNNIVKWWNNTFVGSTSSVKKTGDGISKWWSDLWKGIQTFFQNVWNGIVNIAKIAGALLLAVILGPFIAIGAAFVWLYNHNTYFKQLVDNIVNFFKGCIAWVQNAWNTAVQWLVDKWTYISTMAQVYFAMIQVYIQYYIDLAIKWITDKWNSVVNWIMGKWNYFATLAQMYFAMAQVYIQYYITLAINWLMDRWNTAVSWVSQKWNGFVDLAKSVWQKVSGVFGSIWNTYISKPLNDVWNSITSFWNNTIVGGAANLGRSFVNGIVSGLTSLGGAIHDAISNALAGMGFHDIPGFSLPGHAQGIMNNPSGHWAVVGEQGPEVMYVPSGASIYPNGSSPSSSSTSSGGSQTIVVQLDSQVLMQALGDKQAQYIRLKHGRRVA